MYKPRICKNLSRAQSVIEYVIIFAMVIMASVALAQRAPSIFSGYRDAAIQAIR